MKFELLCGDVIERLRTLPDKSINTCVTSPPYYGLRDYGTGTWVGGDPDCPHYRKSKIVEDHTSTGHAHTFNESGGMGDAIYKTVCPICGAVRVDSQIGLEETPEDYINRLVEVFREVKRVLRDDGILWVNIGDSYSGSRKGRKADGTMCDMTNSPISSKNGGQTGGLLKGGNIPAGTKPKDLIGIPWMLAFALRADGWYLRQDIIWAKNNPMPESVKDRCTRSHEYIFMLTKSRKYYFDHEAIQEPTATYDENVRDRDHTKLNNTPGRSRMAGLKRNNYKTRNKRDVWRVGVCSTVKEAHFAVFPKELIIPCVSAGCPEGGTVLDPFSGSGTTGIVAVQNNRNYIGIELNPEYIEITKRRIEKEIGNEKHEVSVR